MVKNISSIGSSNKSAGQTASNLHVSSQAIPFEAIDYLSSQSDVSFDEVKLSRYLWKFSSDHLKVEKLIQWATSALCQHQTIASDAESLLWKTLADFLSSSELQFYSVKNKKEIDIKSSFTDFLLETLHPSSTVEENHLVNMIDVCKSLSFNKKLSNEFSLRFQTVAKLLSKCLHVLYKFLKEPPKSNVFNCLFDLVKLLLEKLSMTLQDVYVKNGPIFIAKFVMIPALKVYEVLSEKNELHHNETDTVLKLIESIFCEAFFSGKMKPYTCDFGFNVGGNEEPFDLMKGKQLQNPKFCFFLQLHSLSLTSQETLKYLITAYRLYLNTTSKRTPLKCKATFFSNLRTILAQRDDLLLVNTYLKLFKLIVPHELNKLPSDSEHWKELHDFHDAFVKTMVKEKLTDEMLESLGAMATIDYLAIEPNLSEIMQKMLQKVKKNPEKVSASVKFFQAIFHTAFSTRKPQALLDQLIILVIKEIAKNRTKDSVDHCVIVCGVMGRILSQSCSSSLVQSVVLDVWKNLQDKARELIPKYEKRIKENDTESTEEVKGRKRKLVTHDSNSKRIKLDESHSNILHCVLILLTNILENVDFFEFKSQVLSRQKMQKLLEELRILVEDLGRTVTAENDCIGQYYRMLVVVLHQELAEKKYNPIKTEKADYLDAESLEDWEIVSDHELSVRSRYCYKQWQAFKILKLSIHLQQLQLEEVFESEDHDRIKALLNKNILSLLKLDDEALSNSDGIAWNGIPELITDEAMLDVAVISMLKQCLSLVLSVSNEECLSELGSLFVRYYKPKHEVQDGHVTASSLIHDMLHDTVVWESSKFHQIFYTALLEKVKTNIKGSKTNKDLKILIKFAISCVQSTEKIEEKAVESRILTLLSKDRKSNKNLRSAMRTAIKAMLIYPYHSFSDNQKLCFMIVFLCFLATCPDEYSLQEKCFDAVVSIAGLKKDSHLLKLLPVTAAFPYFTQRTNKYTLAGQFVLRKLFRKIYNLSPIEDVLTVISDKNLEKDDWPSSVTWVLDCFCNVMTKHLKIFGCSKYAMMHESDENLFAEENKSHLVVKVQSLKKKSPTDSDANGKALSKICKVIRRVTKKCRKSLDEKVEKIDFELLKFLLLASFYVDLYSENETLQLKKLFEKTKMKNILIDTLCNMKQVNDSTQAISRIQLLLVYFELMLAFGKDEKARENLSIMELGLTWQEINKSIILAYPESAQKHSLTKLLLERMLLCLHFLLPSVKCFLDFASTCVKKLSCGRGEDLKSSFAYIKLVVSSYNKETRSFSLTQGGKNDKRNSLYSTFLLDAFHAIIRMIERLTTSSTPDQSDFSTLRDGLRVLNDIITLAHIIPENQMGRALAVLERINLQIFVSQNDDYFTSMFTAHYNVLSSVVIFYQTSVGNLVPLVQSVLSKLVAAVLSAGRQTQSKVPERSLECALLVERVSHFVTTNFKSHFSRCIPYVLADYINEVGKETLYPSVKTSMDNAMYHLTSMCTDEDINVLNVTMPRNLQAIFQSFYEGYSNYFKYKGWV